MRSHNRSRRNAKTRAALVLLCLLVVAPLALGTLAVVTGDEQKAADIRDLVFLDNSSTLGDSDGDGRLSEEEEEVLDDTTKSADVIRSRVVPSKSVNTLLLTPAGGRWWDLVAGISAQTTLWDMPTPPKSVSWYAYTEAWSYSVEGVKRPYDAIHLAFKSQDEAVGWIEDGSAEGNFVNTNVAYRAGVVTLTPAWVNPDSEPYPDIPRGSLDDVEVGIGLWQIDFAKQVSMRAKESVVPAAYREAFRALGFPASNATWSATSPHPAAVWRGEAPWFDVKNSMPTDAIGILNTSASRCPKGSPCGNGVGLGKGVNMIWVGRSGEGGGEIALRSLVAPKKNDLEVVMGSGWRGAVTGSFEFNHSPVNVMEMWMADGVLSIHPVMNRALSPTPAA